MNVSYVIRDKKKCCGCGACSVICPQKCISMIEDEEGFQYPKIAEYLCIDCGVCHSVCPVFNTIKMDNDLSCYIAYSNDKTTRKNSSSGGIFTELAKNLFEKRGIVYGAGFDTNFEVVHKGVTCAKDLELIRGSKYVQSKMNFIYEDVKKNIAQGKYVYFSGTPCQISGLYLYLGSRPGKLLTQDFICHGVPSPLVWRKYINTFGNVDKVEFRSKKYGWHYFSLHVKSDKKNYCKRLNEDIYLKLFLDNTILRPICYDCPIKKHGSVADITLADCWNIAKITDKINDTDRGLSLVIVNTVAGKKFWNEAIKYQEVFHINVDTKRALDSQETYKKSVKYHPKRELFFDRLINENFSNLLQGWYKISKKEAIKNYYIFIKTKVNFCVKLLRKNK